MRRILPPLVLLSLLTGCSLFQRTVVVPCPPPPAAIRPALKTKNLRDNSTILEVLQAYVLDLIAMDGYASRLEAYLDAYRPPPEPAKAFKTESPK